MRQKRIARPSYSNDDIRLIMLGYFYERNKNATSPRGKKGSAVKISDIKRELKASHQLSQNEVVSNLTYLISEKWVEEGRLEKTFAARGGTMIPSSTSYYQITSAGIDRIEGPGAFTMPKFHGINLNAIGQNVITVGDGNQINAKFGDLGQSLADLRDAITKSDEPEERKFELVADIESIQSQLAKQAPNSQIIGLAWESVKTAANIDGCVELVHKISHGIGALL